MHRAFYKLFLYCFMTTLLLSSQLIMGQTARTYHEAMQKGKAELAQGKLIDAKAYFLMALQMKPGDSLANAQIKAVVNTLKKEGEHKEVYYQWLDQGDAFLNNGALDAARQAYEKALNVLPGDPYAIGKIKQIDALKQAQKDKLQAYNDFISKGDLLLQNHQFSPALFAFKKADSLYPDKKLPKIKIQATLQRQKEYQQKTKRAELHINKAKQYLLIKDYLSALKELYKADSLIPDNLSLQSRISQIAPLAQKQSKYNQWIQEGDQLYLTKNFMAARMKYQQAVRVWPEQTYPGDMISRIDARLQQQRAHLEENYRKAVHQADSLFRQSDWENARAEYNLALNLKPDEVYPKNQIQAIDKALLAQKAKQMALYAGIIRRGDSLFNLKQFMTSRKLFQMAQELKPTDPYPPKRLKEIDAKLELFRAAERLNTQYKQVIATADSLYHLQRLNEAMGQYNRALELKPSEEYPQSQIDLIKKELVAIKNQKVNDEKYALQMQKGTALFDQSKWNEALTAFQKALAIKPGEKSPSDYIRRIDSIQQQLVMQHNLDSTYRKFFAEGSQQLNLKKYQQALLSFEEAQKLKPAEPAPGQKITEIKNILAEIKRTAALNEQYQVLISAGDSLLKEKHYELSLQKYQEALKLKPGEPYPQNKISQINTTLIQLAKEKEQRYNKAVADGDRSFKSQDYKNALTSYQTALSIKPDATYPAQQISQCKTQLSILAQQLLKQYRQVMSEADQYYNGKIFDQAIASYRKAHEIMPDETRPVEMIRTIMKYIEDHAVEDISNQTVQLQANQRKTFKFKPVNVAVRDNNYVLIKARNVDGKAFNVLFTYGKDGESNGGFVLQVPAGKASHEFIIRVGTQYKWFSEDNNWMSVYPENNPLEISLIRISKGD
ncbi:MAG: tetratricopeptide repeat protein [Bacteroidales bacterium]|nr:tetratricopeptide repeat protein [Bacteroidales bacterium]